MGSLLLAQLRHRWLESAAVALLFAVVVAALIAHRSVVHSGETTIHALAHKLGENMLVLPKAMDLTAFYGLRYGSETLPADAPEAIRSSEVAEHVGFIRSQLYSNVTVRDVQVVLIGEDTGWPADVWTGAYPAVVGREAARRLGLRVGNELLVEGVRLKVVQIVDVAGGELDDAILTTISAAQLITNRPGEVNAMRLGGCWCRLDIPDLAKKIEIIVPGSRAITAAGMIAAQRGLVSTVRRYTGALYGVSIIMVVGTILALVASQLRRHRREIGLLHAIGAEPSALTLLYTFRAGLGGAVGGVVGYLLAFPLTTIATSTILGVKVAPEPGLFGPVLVLSVGVSTVSAFVLARRAARLDPVDVLTEV